VASVSLVVAGPSAGRAKPSPSSFPSQPSGRHPPAQEKEFPVRAGAVVERASVRGIAVALRATTVVCSLTACSSGASRSLVRGGATTRFLLGKRQCFVPNRTGSLLMGGGVADPALACFSFSLLRGGYRRLFRALPVCCRALFPSN
jgi:hypothetical protein